MLEIALYYKISTNYFYHTPSCWSLFLQLICWTLCLCSLVYVSIDSLFSWLYLPIQVLLEMCASKILFFIISD
jgi:hypothetical protein